MSQQIDELLALLRAHAERLNQIDTPSTTATPCYELMSGGLVWTDERITSVPSEVIWALRPLFAHRASLIKGELDAKWAAYWAACIEMFPRWIGFLPERAKPTAQNIALLKRGDTDMLRELDAAMNADGSAEPSTLTHPNSSLVFPIGYSEEWEALGIITREEI